jgi:ketosteroid isomerase-like protein
MTPCSRLVLALATLLAACATPSPPPTTPPTKATVAPSRPAVAVDLAQGQALTADEAFSDATVAHDPRAFAAFLTRDAVFIGRGGVSAGLAAVCSDWAPLLRPGGPTLSWKPISARGSSGGDLVVTQGTWALQPADGGAVQTGRYVTVWEREPDGTLRVALDAPDKPLPAESARAERRPLKRVVSDDQHLSAVAGLLMDGGREAGGFLLVETRDGDTWRVLAEVGSWRPAAP